MVKGIFIPLGPIYPEMAKRITKQTYLEWFTLMLRLRKFEEKAGQLYGQQKIRGFCHLYIGQEAIAAGAMSALNEDDNIITAYRDHGLAIAKGIGMNEAMAELYGKATGSTKGKGGSMHYFSKEHRFFGGHGIVGAQIPLGAGIAFADKYRKEKRVTLCFFGDGAAWQGSLHESFNLAELWNLPVVYICENNGYAMGTSVERSASNQEIFEMGKAYRMPSRPVNGMDPAEVYREISAAVEDARNGKGPTFLEIRTYRYKGHSMSDPGKYRTRDEVKQYREIDPIEQVRKTILAKKYASAEELDQIEAKVLEGVEASVQFAEDSPFPDERELFTDVYKQEDYPFLID